MDRISPRRKTRHVNLLAVIADLGSQTALADLIGTPKSHINSMAKGHRGVGDEIAARIERKTSKKPGWMDQQHPSEGAQSGGDLAQDLIHPIGDDELPKLTWEFILTGADLPARFEAATPDDALAPKTPRGTSFIFSTTKRPQDEDVVIVHTPAGRRHMRLFYAISATEWEARTRDPAQPPLNSARDGITLLAVATHRAGGQG